MKIMKFLRRPNPPAAVTILLLLAFVTGCANNAVVFTTMTRTGIEINAAEGGQQSVHVGFDRFEGVLMPLVHTNDANQAVTLKQAYPVYAEYEFASGGLTAASATNGGAMILRQVFATGKAATKPAVQKKVSEDFQALRASNSESAVCIQTWMAGSGQTSEEQTRRMELVRTHLKNGSNDDIRHFLYDHAAESNRQEFIQKFNATEHICP